MALLVPTPPVAVVAVVDAVAIAPLLSPAAAATATTAAVDAIQCLNTVHVERSGMINRRYEMGFEINKYSLYLHR